MVLAILAFGLGIYVSGAGARSERALAARYVRDWSRGDFPAMYRLLSPASRRRWSETAFAAQYAAAADTATLESIRPGRVGAISGAYVRVPVRARTRIFGTLREMLQVPISGGANGPYVAFGGTLLFPGLRPGEQLIRHSVLAARGSILADDGTPLAQGPGRTSPIPAVAGEIVGTLGPIPASERSTYDALGYPADAQVAQDGLELIFQKRLVGRIGGTLLAGHRVLARAPAAPGKTVKTTIDPTLEQAAISALGGAYAGMTVIDPKTGGLLALAGLAFSAVQPPGSTMKIVTSTAVLQSGLATLGTEFPVMTAATIDGYTLHNSDNEACGGTLLNAFAVSCNSVFAPLGAQLGAQRLVSTAQRFGFNHATGIPGALESTIPSAATIGDALAVGSSAIGQGKVLASTLEMADIGATIADAGRRPIPTLVYGAKPRFVRVTTPKVAGEVQQMMEAVVEFGTGTAAQIPGVEVAGKTGTAELTNTSSQANATQDTDAWFVGYAPVGDPRVVVCALFPNAGFGGDTAAPAVQQVLVAALGLG